MKKILLLTTMFLILASAFGQDKNDNRGYKVKVGEAAPDFTVTYLDGKTAKLGDFKGKTVMLQFTASWCGVCRKEMPHIESDIWQRNKSNKNFVLLGIDLKENAETIKKFAAATGVTYPITLDPDGAIFELYAQKNAGVTRNILIDKSGKIVFLTRLYDENEFSKLKAEIEKQLKK